MSWFFFETFNARYLTILEFEIGDVLHQNLNFPTFFINPALWMCLKWLRVSKNAILKLERVNVISKELTNFDLIIWNLVEGSTSDS